MKRGEVWTISGHSDYASKTRPAVIVQSDIFGDTASITVCLITSDQTDADLFRIPIEPSEANGLKLPSRMMVDKIDTLPKSKLGRRIGQLSTEDITRLNRAMIVFLGLATSSQARR
jgi:mRNA interferase MazF